jgi:hypothetical protein
MSTYRAAGIAGCSQQMIRVRLRRLNEKYPGVCPKLKAAGRNSRYEGWMKSVEVI